MKFGRLLFPALVPLVAMACGVSGSEPESNNVAQRTITVFAAASLTEAFTALGAAFETTSPGVSVNFNFAASSELVTQIVEGAPADVFAAADTTTMSRLIEAGLTAADPVVFTTNRAEIIVATGNPRAISSVADLADPDLVVIGCAPEVPCGRYATTLLERAGVAVTFKSLEENVRAVVAKVTLGEADAGIVYTTDVIAAGDAATGVAIPEDINVTAEYPIVVITDNRDTAGSQGFVDFVLSPQGRRILASFGFRSP
ncbi:MAG: molybdate ABC transporter substrate-binding protein [Ilumatobacteraceae bacterium]